MNTNAAALQFEIQQKQYAKGVLALKDLSFEVNSGEFVAIVGPSGAGKTTLLNMLAGLDQDFIGHIRWNGGSAQKANMAFMFQEPRLMPWLSVRQNIELVLSAKPKEKQHQAQALLMNLLERVGLAEFADAFPHQLSGGMQKRAALVRAFIIQPNLLLMDEPFQSLDEPTADQLRAILLELWVETQAVVLFVTHSLREALLLADRVLFLSARPAKVILDYTVPLSRPRQSNAENLEAVYQALFVQHPKLLSGCMGEESVRSES